MKNILISASLLLSIAKFSFAQDFAPLGSQWYYDAMDSGQAPYHSEYFLYTSEKDTVVMNTSCKKISIIKYGYDGNIHLYAPLFVFGDTNEVFYFNTRFEKFCSLYKFNVSIGDTLDFYTLPGDFVTDTIFKVRVDNIYYANISNRMVKFINTNPLPTLSGYSFSFWGVYCHYIGGLNLMLPQQLPNILEMDGPIRCYSDSNPAFSFKNIFLPMPCDSTITGEVTLQNSFNLLYDFTKNLLYIQADNPGEISVRISDILGRVVYQKELRGNDSHQIELNDLPAGLYIVQCSTDQDRFPVSKKIIKQ